MAKLGRFKQKVFANSGVTNQFGGEDVAAPLATKNVKALQNLVAFDNGWASATVSGDFLPVLEEMNGVEYVNTYQLAYLLEEGWPEYDYDTAYNRTSIVKKSGTSEIFSSVINGNVNYPIGAVIWSNSVTYQQNETVSLSGTGAVYRSLVDGNLNNTPPNVAFWELISTGPLNYSGATSYSAGQVVRETSTGNIYRSVTDGNLGNALSNPTFWQLTWVFLGDVQNISQATETKIGTAEIATQAETNAGLDDLRFVTPLKLKNSLPSLAGTLIPGYINGLLPSNAGGDPAHDIVIAPGVALSSGNAVYIKLPAPMTKQLDVTWADGNNNGGRAPGVPLVANTRYYIFLLGKNDGTASFVYDSSPVGANSLLAPISVAGYTEIRYLGAVKTDGSGNILPGFWVDLGAGRRYFQYSTPVLDVDVLQPNASVTYSISVPAGQSVEARIIAFFDDGTAAGDDEGFIYFRNPNSPDVAPSPLGPAIPQLYNFDPTTEAIGACQIDIFTDSSSQLAARAGPGASSPVLRISTLGYAYTV